MLYGINKETGVLIEPIKEASALCPGCNQPLVAKMGDINIHHWAHISADCDLWHEPEGPWHRAWKGMFNKEHVERVIGSHRADVVTGTGLVIELQSSSISPEEIRKRESFYKNMIWVFDLTEADRFEYVNRGGYESFRFYHPKRSIAYCKKPVFLNLANGELFQIGSMNHNAGRGWGHVGTIEEFLTMSHFLGNEFASHAPVNT